VSRFGSARPAFASSRTEPGFARQHDRPVSTRHVQLREQVADMVAHRLVGEVQLGGDLGVVEAACNRVENFVLAGGQRIEGTQRSRRWRDRMQREKGVNLGDESRPRGLVGAQVVVGRFERDEAA
jgi:hypothetical protein